MWVHYVWYRIKIRSQINTVPTPTVAWTRAQLIQMGGGRTTFPGNNTPQTPRKTVTRINIKHGNDRMGIVNQMSLVMCRNCWCSYSERRYIWTPMRRPRKDRRSTRCQSHHLSHHWTHGDTLREGRQAHNNGRHTLPYGAAQIKDTTARHQKVSIYCHVSY